METYVAIDKTGQPVGLINASGLNQAYEIALEADECTVFVRPPRKQGHELAYLHTLNHIWTLCSSSADER